MASQQAPTHRETTRGLRQEPHHHPAKPDPWRGLRPHHPGLCAEGVMRLALDPEAMRAHWTALYGTAESGYLPLWHLPTQRTAWVDGGDVAAVVNAVARLSEAGNIYNGVGLHP